ncbi:MAG: hypothetical protein LUD27_04820 [Clostridia bacterium]|nr:hypothetical protein [Clostridia bacterium]
MGSRPNLQKLLEDILGSRNVYYQPPPSVQMSYPAIVYARSEIQNNYAENNVYLQNFAYQLTVIDKNPDSDIVKKISVLPKCHFSRHFKSDNLNHDVFIIFY